MNLIQNLKWYFKKRNTIKKQDRHRKVFAQTVGANKNGMASTINL
jgi:hypothetical protein